MEGNRLSHKWVQSLCSVKCSLKRLCTEEDGEPLQISWQPCLKNSLNAVSVTHNYLHQPCKKILLALLPTFSLFACRPSIQNWVSRASIFLFLTAWVHNMLECIQYQDEVIINMFLKDWKGTDKNNRTLKWFSSHHTWFTNLLATLYVKG